MEENEKINKFFMKVPR